MNGENHTYIIISKALPVIKTLAPEKGRGPRSGKDLDNRQYLGNTSISELEAVLQGSCLVEHEVVRC